MDKNGSKKGVTPDLQYKYRLEQLKIRSSTETAKIKEEFWDAREGSKRLYQDRVRIVDLQREVETMWMEMVNTD